MVKLQKPIPKKMGNKPKLDNPIKKKKQLSKEKSTGSVKSIKTKLLESPIKEAKQVKLEKNLVKEVPQKKNEAPKATKPEKKSKSEVKVLSAPVTQKPKESKESKEVPVSKKDKKPKTQNKDEQKQLAPVKTAAPIKPLAPATKTAPAKKDVPPPKKSAPLKKSAPSSQKQTPEPTIKPPKPEQIKKKKNKKSAPPVEGAAPVVEPKADKKVVELQTKKKSKIAFKKAKVTAEANPWRNKDKKEKKEVRDANAVRYEPIPFDEEKFNAIVNLENIRKITEALKKQVEKEVAAKKKSIFEDYRYFLQIGSFKIANCPKRMVKINLKHSLVDKDDDVLLVVPDQQRGAKADYEPTLHHYEDLLRSQGVEGITVMPMNQLRKEFRTFEQKRRLCASYEHFLCDGRIVSHVVGVVGKIGQKPRHTFHAVRMEDPKHIKSEIEKALRKTAFRQLAKSSLHAIPVGTHKFTEQQVADNVSQVVEQLKKLFPGGLANIRNLYLKIDLIGTSALPLYLSMAQAPDQTPMVVGPREQRMIKLKREANEVLSKFAMTKEGKLIKLTRPEVEKKRKLQEMKAALKEDDEVAAKKAKKAKKDVGKEKKEEVKDLELPVHEEDDDEESSDEDDEEDDVVQFEGSSDDDEEEMAQSDQEDDEAGVDAESETEILENGLVEEDEEESGEEDQQNIDESDEEDDDDDNDDDEEGDDDDDDEEEESD